MNRDVLTAILFAVAGLSCGTAQFFFLRFAVRNALRKNRVWLLVLQPIIPVTLLIVSAIISVRLVFVPAVAYTAVLATLAVVNLIKGKNSSKEGD